MARRPQEALVERQAQRLAGRSQAAQLLFRIAQGLAQSGLCGDQAWQDFRARAQQPVEPGLQPCGRTVAALGEAAEFGLHLGAGVFQRTRHLAQVDQAHARLGELGLQPRKVARQHGGGLQLAPLGEQDEAHRLGQAAHLEPLVGVAQRLLGLTPRRRVAVAQLAHVAQARHRPRELLAEADIGGGGLLQWARRPRLRLRLAAQARIELGDGRAGAVQHESLQALHFLLRFAGQALALAQLRRGVAQTDLVAAQFLLQCGHPRLRQAHGRGLAQTHRLGDRRGDPWRGRRRGLLRLLQRHLGRLEFVAQWRGALEQGAELRLLRAGGAACVGQGAAFAGEQRLELFDRGALGQAGAPGQQCRRVVLAQALLQRRQVLRGALSGGAQRARGLRRGIGGLLVGKGRGQGGLGLLALRCVQSRLRRQGGLCLGDGLGIAGRQCRRARRLAGRGGGFGQEVLQPARAQAALGVRVDALQAAVEAVQQGGVVAAHQEAEGGTLAGELRADARASAQAKPAQGALAGDQVAHIGVHLAGR